MAEVKDQILTAYLKLDMCPWDTDAPAIAKFV